MTQIDWTKPVETDENPPRPVRVLATDGPCAKFPVIAVVGNAFHREFSRDGLQDEASHVIPLRLRNVAPKLVPVEADRDHWKAKAEALQVEVHQLSSAGLIVEMKAEVKRLAAENEALQADVARMKPFYRDVEALSTKHGIEVTGLDAQILRLEDEIQAMRPVVDAAVAWVLPELRGSYAGDTQRLIETVRAYQDRPRRESTCAPDDAGWREMREELGTMCGGEPQPEAYLEGEVNDVAPN